MATTRRRSTRKQADDEAAPATVDPPQTGILRNDIHAELQKVRDEVANLDRKAAAAEERAFHMLASMKELRQKHEDDVQRLGEALVEMREKLNVVETHGKRLFKTIRNSKRDEVAELMQQSAKAKGGDDKLPVDDNWSTIRAASMLKQLDDVRSDIGSCVSDASRRFW